MHENKIGKLFLLEYKDRCNQIHIGNKIGIVLYEHPVSYLSGETYKVLLEDKIKVISCPITENISYNIRFI